MNMQQIIDRLGKKAGQVIEKAIQCQSEEELIEFASENQITLSKQEISLLLGNSGMGELGDDDLAAVSGGFVSERSREDLFLDMPRCSAPDCGGIMFQAMTFVDGAPTPTYLKCTKCGRKA
jgi:hypothetical protein